MFSNKIDKLIGRSEEVERIVQILARRTKNNPLLVVFLLLTPIPLQFGPCSIESQYILLEHNTF